MEGCEEALTWTPTFQSSLVFVIPLVFAKDKEGVSDVPIFFFFLCSGAGVLNSGPCAS
jgi:hypothetical protein